MSDLLDSRIDFMGLTMFSYSGDLRDRSRKRTFTHPL